MPPCFAVRVNMSHGDHSVHKDNDQEGRSNRAKPDSSQKLGKCHSVLVAVTVIARSQPGRSAKREWQVSARADVRTPAFERRILVVD